MFPKTPTMLLSLLVEAAYTGNKIREKCRNLVEAGFSHVFLNIHIFRIA
jgi:hypothetical protein